MNTILFTIVAQIKNISILLNPIIPISTNKVFDLMNISPKLINLDSINNNKILDLKKELNPIEILFKKVENDN